MHIRYGCRRPSVAVAILASLFTSVASGTDVAAFADALKDGKAAVDLRYRYEHVDQDNISREADASTLRLRLNYATGAVQGFSGFVEFDYVAEVLLDSFNSGDGSNPGRTVYPVVADPHGTDLNQLYLDYSNGKQFSARFGRQRILLDNQRFVGGVGWRQNEQTYDGLTLTMSEVMNATVRYSWVSRVKRIFGARSPAGNHDGNIHLLNVTVPLNQRWTATPYVYVIDNDDEAQFSSTTIGARVHGGINVGDLPFTLAVDFATQADAANAPVDYRANYLRLDAGLNVTESLNFGVGYERLGGDENAQGKAFRTPLATLHAFQGWADQFLNTPDAGIADTFASVRYTHEAWTITGVLHNFQADAGSADYGNELDVTVGRRLADRYDLLLKAAYFNADDQPFADTAKLWLMLSAGF